MTPATSFRIVDLPEPLGPIIPKVSPLLTVKEMSFRAVNDSWVFSPINKAGRNSLKVLCERSENSLVTWQKDIIGVLVDMFCLVLYNYFNLPGMLASRGIFLVMDFFWILIILIFCLLSRVILSLSGVKSIILVLNWKDPLNKTVFSMQTILMEIGRCWMAIKAWRKSASPLNR